jgi:hypothetical protein
MYGQDDKMEVLIETVDSALYRKLNSLIKDAAGKYIWILGDTDLLSSYALAEVLILCERNPDYICLGTSFSSDLIDQWKERLVESKKVQSYFPIKKELAGNFPKSGDGWINKISKKVKTVEVLNKPAIHKSA